MDDITHIQTVRLRQWSWPVMVKISLDGTRQIYTTTLKGVRLETNKGQRIILGSTDPERLASSIAKARTSGT
ncbi:hypothetical protein HNR42_001334 [Deinobacterium chartae]|uniref:Uncharacterized protein n=1 Tax=Deinobacterium chartae TaxID=521158 RepID=A0A841HWK2_9DEIO|nr:hypothetical protein [Deinobacterium chartae]MBB6097911.1 hypothetical protein [Deinobacterium chartae]